MATAAGQPRALRAAWFVELRGDLATAVEAWWARLAGIFGCPLYRRAASDVWDLVRDEGRLIRQLCEELPRDVLLLVVAGTPCQQLSR